MTRETAIKMIESKLLCTACEIAGTSEDCDNCRLNYEQGNLGEQKKWLAMALAALKQPERKHGRWTYIGNAIGKHKVYECSRCHSLINGRANYCKECGAIMDEEG